MKKIIRTVLDGLSGSNLNFDSDAVRELITISITSALEESGVYREECEYENNWNSSCSDCEAEMNDETRKVV